MKYLFCLLISFFSFISIHAQIKAKQMDKKNGHVKIYFSNTQIIQEEGDVHKHLKTGLWKTYDEKGKVMFAENFTNGIVNGLYYKYFASGTIWEKGSYTNGIKTGEWQENSAKGTISSIHHYDLNGNEIGVQETFWYGGSVQTYEVIDSLGNKFETDYNQFGEMTFRKSFKNGEPDGNEYIYHSNRNAADTFPVMITQFHNGKKNGYERKYNHGKLIREDWYKNDKQDSISWNNENPKVIIETHYKDGKKNGSVIAKINSGKIIQEVNYINGQKDGKEIYFDTLGKIKELYYWQSDKLDSELEYFPDGKLLSRHVIDYILQKDDFTEYSQEGNIIHHRTSNYSVPQGTEEFFYSNRKKKCTVEWEKPYLTYSKGNGKVWDENGKLVIEFICESEGYKVTELEKVYDANGKLIPNTEAKFDNVIQKYLPEYFIPYFNSKGIANGKMGDYEAPPPPLQDVDQTENPPEQIFTFAEVMPTFPGPEGAFLEYIQKNLKYPQIDKENGKTGTAYVQFTVGKDGSISNVKIAKSTGSPGLDKEALRLISQMPKWNVAQMNGRPVSVQMIQPVKFSLL
jgi:TonB family protein